MREPKKKARTKSNPVQLPSLCIVRGCVQRAAEHGCLCLGCHTYLTTGDRDAPLARRSRARRLAAEDVANRLTDRLRNLMIDES